MNNETQIVEGLINAWINKAIRGFWQRLSDKGGEE